MASRVLNESACGHLRGRMEGRKRPSSRFDEDELERSYESRDRGFKAQKFKEVRKRRTVLIVCALICKSKTDWERTVDGGGTERKEVELDVEA